MPTGVFPRPSLKERIEKHRKIDEFGCWLWTGPVTNTAGHGHIVIIRNGKRTSTTVHRVAAHVYKGFDLDSKLQQNHTCKNPHCFNPEHFYEGTQGQNMSDWRRK